jgi:hypothetical protein
MTSTGSAKCGSIFEIRGGSFACCALRSRWPIQSLPKLLPIALRRPRARKDGFDAFDASLVLGTHCALAPADFPSSRTRNREIAQCLGQERFSRVPSLFGTLPAMPFGKPLCTLRLRGCRSSDRRHSRMAPCSATRGGRSAWPRRGGILASPLFVVHARHPNVPRTIGARCKR